MSQVNPTCPNCGASVSANAKFCRTCGKPIEPAEQLPSQSPPPAPPTASASQPTCPHCGAAISPTAKFCKACGKTIGEAPSQPHAPVVPAQPSAAPAHSKSAAGTTMPSAQPRKTLLFALGGVALVCVCLATCLVGSIALTSGSTKIALPALQGPTLAPSRATSVTPPVPQTRVSPVVRQTLVSKSVAPSNQPQTVSWNNAVSVTIPANGVTQAQTLAISTATNPRPTSSDSLQVMDVFEIKLGDQTRFVQPLALELAFDPQKVSSPDDVGMAYWNDQAQTWIPVPSRIDAKRNVVTTHATHLSFWTWYYKKRGWDVERSLDFILVYDPKQYFFVGKQQMSGRDFANYLLGTLQSTLGKYCGKRTDSGCSLFKAPAMSDDEGIERFWVFAGNAASNPQDPEWKRFPEQIVFPQSYDSELALRHDAAHELFHAVQARYFYMTYHFWTNQWYLEGTADYAAAKIVLDDKSFMGHDELNSGFLEQSLTAGETAHTYATSHFFDYLFSHNPGLTFKEMWDAVADPAIYDSGSVLGPLDKYLESKLGAGKGMGYQFKQFAQFLVFDPTSPVKVKKASPAIDFGNAQCANTFRANQTEVVCELSLPNYSALVWSLLPEMEAGKTTRTIKVEQIDPTVSAVLVHLKGDKRIAPPYYAMTLLVPPTVEVSKDDSLLIQAYSTETKILMQKAKFRVTAEAKSGKGSCWVLDKTDTQKTLQSPPDHTPRVEINNGSATISHDWLQSGDCKGYSESTFSWTPLPTTLIPGQTIKVTFGGKRQTPPKCTGGACSIYFLVGDKRVAENDRWPADSTYDWKVPDTSNYCFTQRSDGRKLQFPLVATFDMVGPGGKGKFIYSYKCQESAACP